MEGDALSPIVELENELKLLKKKAQQMERARMKEWKSRRDAENELRAARTECRVQQQELNDFVARNQELQDDLGSSKQEIDQLKYELDLANAALEATHQPAVEEEDTPTAPIEGELDLDAELEAAELDKINQQAARRIKELEWKLRTLEEELLDKDNQLLQSAQRQLELVNALNDTEETTSFYGGAYGSNPAEARQADPGAQRKSSRRRSVSQLAKQFETTGASPIMPEPQYRGSLIKSNLPVKQEEEGGIDDHDIDDDTPKADDEMIVGGQEDDEEDLEQDRVLREELTQLQEAHEQELARMQAQLSQNEETFESQRRALEAQLSQLENALSNNDTAVGQTLAKISRRYNQERAQNARLLERLAALKGNIQVCCRVRPYLEGEQKASLTCEDGSTLMEAIAAPQGETVLVFADKPAGSPALMDKCQRRFFNFDHVWGQTASQADVFAEIEPLIACVGKGFACSILAYGQTGAGKTYTMLGEPGARGVSFLALQRLFDVYGPAAAAGADDDEERQTDLELTSLKLSCVEVYNEECRDLLTSMTLKETMSRSAAPTNTVDIRKGPGGRIQLKGAHWEAASSVDEAFRVLTHAERVRSTRGTKGNQRSSRSHFIVIVDVETKSTAKGESGAVHHGRMFIADLAGSERLDTASSTDQQTLLETQHVNRSLAALGDVVEALAQGSDFIPYRNSKLTYLLQESLSQGSRTLMVLAVVPTVQTVAESLFTMQFAARVRRVELGPVSQGGKDVRRLEEALAAMRRALNAAQKEKQMMEQQLSLLHKRQLDLRTGQSREAEHLRKQITHMQTKIKKRPAGKA